MSTIQFTAPSECDAFTVHVGQGSAGDNIESNVYGDPYPEDSKFVRRINYSKTVHGRIEYTPPPPYASFIGDPDSKGKTPWGFGNQVIPPGKWIITLLDDNAAYVCITRKEGHKLDYVDYFYTGTHVFITETWAVPLGGPATINGIVIPEFGIAHKMTGIMEIADADTVVCLAERI